MQYREGHTVGEFIGYLTPEFDNSHDKYAIIVFDEIGGHRGYVSKGNYRLFNYLSTFQDHKLFCWGYVGYDSFEHRWSGSVRVPTGYEPEVVRSMKNYFRNRIRIESFRHNINLSTLDLFQLLDFHMGEGRKFREAPYFAACR